MPAVHGEVRCPATFRHSDRHRRSARGPGSRSLDRRARVPIYQTSSYVFESADHAAALFALQQPGHIYTRIGNPTTEVLERRLAELDGGVGALALASGQAAISTAVLTLATPGDNIVSTRYLYGGTYNLFHYTLERLGIEARFVDTSDPQNVTRAIDAKDAPRVHGVDREPEEQRRRLRGARRDAHAAGVPFVVDNTGLAVCLQAVRSRRRPHRLFADEVHRRPRHVDRREHRRLPAGSTGRTGGSPSSPGPTRRTTASCSGICSARTIGPSPRRRVHHEGARAAAARLRRVPVAVQRVPVPAGSRDAACRMAAHCANAAKVASWLAAHPRWHG